jgi:hypothetical protein
MKKLYWQDPEPVDNNDYVINKVNGVECNTLKDIYDILNGDIKDDTILRITYADGYSEAEVFADEIVEVDVKYNTWLEVEQVITFDDGDEHYINFDESVEKRNTHDSIDEVKRELELLRM